MAGSERIFYGERYRGERGEVQHVVSATTSTIQRFAIGDRPADEIDFVAHSREVCFAAGEKIVEYANGMAATDKLVRGVGTNESSAAGYQVAHRVPLGRKKFISLVIPISFKGAFGPRAIIHSASCLWKTSGARQSVAREIARMASADLRMKL